MFLLMKRWTDKGQERHTTPEQESEALKNVCCLQRKKNTKRKTWRALVKFKSIFHMPVSMHRFFL